MEPPRLHHRPAGAGPPELEVRRGDARPTSAGPGTTTRHALSYGLHHDPAEPGNTSFGPLVLHDEHLLEAGAGFGEHPHRGLEVVTWVLDGLLLHLDDTGGRARVGPGTVQVLSSGTGVRHAERAGRLRTRVVQAWLLADEPLAAPHHTVHDAAPALHGAGLVALAGEGAPLPLACAGARLSAARLPAGGSVGLPSAPLVHVQVARGGTDEPADLVDGDVVRLRDAGPLRVVAGGRGVEILVWELPARGDR